MPRLRPGPRIVHSARTPVTSTVNVTSGISPPRRPRSTASPLVLYARVNSAAYATVIPLLYGTNRVSPTILWFGDWMVVPAVQNSGVSGTAAPSTSPQTQYSVSMLLAFCEGPGTGFGRLWQANGKQSFSAAFVAANFTEFVGSFTEQAWSYLTTKHPEEALPYRGLMKLGGANFNVGTSPQLPQLNLEVSGLQVFGRNILDAEPSDIIFDMLTNPFHGAAFPAANLDIAGTWEIYAEANVAVGLFISPLMDSQQSAAQWLQLILNMTVASAVWSDGLLKILPFYDQPVAANGASYVPQLTPVIPSSGPDDYLDIGGSTASEPITSVRALPADRFSEIRIEITNRSNNYNVETAYASSQSDIDVYSLRTAQAVQYHPITTALTGQKVARMQLTRGLTVRNQFHFSLSQKYIWLDPLDIWPLTAPELGLLNYPVRILSIELDLKENLNVIAEDLGICNATGLVGGERHGSAQPPTINPLGIQPINPPVIFEETAAMTYGRIYVCIALSGQNANVNWGGANVLWSEDNINFEQIGTVVQPAKQGILLSDLPAYGGRIPDNVNTLSVDLSQSAGSIPTVAFGNAQAKHNLLVVCNNDGSNIEFMSIQKATALGSFQFNCTTLFRALYGTTATLHSATNSQVAFLGYVTALDQGIFRWEYPLRLVGQTIFFKFPSLDVSRLVQQNPNDATQVATYAYSLIGGNSKQVIVNNFSLVNFQSTVVAQIVAGLIAQGQQVLVTALGTLTASGTISRSSVSFQIIDGTTTITSESIQIPAAGDYPIQLALQYGPARTANHTYQLKAQASISQGGSIVIDTVTLEIGIISPNVVQEG